MKKENTCIFCKIIAGDVPSTKIYEDDRVVVIKDIAPKAPIHYLIMPKKHFSDICQLQEEDVSLAGHLLLVAKKLATSDGKTSDFRLVVNNGAEAGQIVFHLHIHFLAGKKQSNDI
jgi:histidine triad (HIT) family protein